MAGSASSTWAPPPRPSTRATRSCVEPGRLTTSATSPSSDGGMLSMTYHPESSRAAAAVDLPAPDMPVITR